MIAKVMMVGLNSNHPEYYKLPLMYSDLGSNVTAYWGRGLFRPLVNVVDRSV